MPATDLPRLSCYGFTAASIAVFAAVVFYVTAAFALAHAPRQSARRNPLAAWRAYVAPPTVSGRLASTTAGIATLFAGRAVALRVVATGR